MEQDSFQSSFDSSVGRAVDCSRIHRQISIGRWFKSGSKDFFSSSNSIDTFVQYLLLVVKNPGGWVSVTNRKQSLQCELKGNTQQVYCSVSTFTGVPLAQRIARWTSNPKVLGSIPRWDENIFLRKNIFSSQLGKQWPKRIKLILFTAHLQDKELWIDSPSQ